MSRCRSCNAPLLWAKTEKGHRIPLDPEPVPADGPGLFVLRHGVAVAVPPLAYPDEANYISHFSTCPQADQHRRSR
jgi:hypothetical protein